MLASFAFELPSSTAWIYAAFVVAIALFFQFTRPFSLRNWDLVGLFLHAPGFLLLDDYSRTGNAAQRYAGYGWLLLATGVWSIRCLLDARLVRRGRHSPNLTRPGLYWLGVCLLVGLAAAAALANESERTVGKPPVVIAGVEQTAAVVVQQVQAEQMESVSPLSVRLWVSRAVGILCQIAVVAMLVLIGRVHFNDPTTAISAALVYMLLPATAFLFTQSHHVWPSALLLGAILLFRHPHWAGVLLGLAAGTSFFPLLLFPSWIQFYHGRGARRFAFWFAVSAVGSLLLTILSLWLAGDYTTGLWQSQYLRDWQPWLVPMAESIWTGGRWIYRLPLFIVHIGFVLFTIIWPSSKNLGQLIAVNAMILLGLQYWYADRGGAYVLWYAPLLILMVLRPTTVELVPPELRDLQPFRWLRRKATSEGQQPSPPVLAV